MNATPAITATATSAISAAASAAAPNGTPTSPMPVVGLFAKPEDRALFAGHSCAGHASTRHNSPASVGPKGLQQLGKTRQALRKETFNLLTTGRIYVLDPNKTFAPAG